MADCSFFIAPYLATTQLAQFFNDEVIQVAFGSSKLLCFEGFEQAIVDFDLTTATFTFIDREDLQLGNKDKLSALADYFVLSGTIYGQEIQFNEKNDK